MASVRYDVKFIGRVQGVFFRATAQEISRDFKVTGWVCNDPDGSVRLVAEGKPDELDRFIASIQQAKRANITDARIAKSPATGEFAGFSIRH